MASWMYEHSLPLDWHPEGCQCDGCLSFSECADKCRVCGEYSAWEKSDTGYFGLYHCSACGAWDDRMSDQAWKFDRPNEST